MRSTVTDRTRIDSRALLWGAAATVGLALAPRPAEAGGRLLVATVRLPDRRFAVLAMTTDGSVRFATPLP